MNHFTKLKSRESFSLRWLLLSLLLLVNVGVRAQDKTLHFVFDSSVKDAITGNNYNNQYNYHRWTVSNEDATIYMGGRIGVQNGMMAMRYGTNNGEMLGNIDPDYDANKSNYNVPDDATGAIPGRIKKITVKCGGNLSRGIYIYAGTKQIVDDDTAPKNLSSYDVKSAKLSGQEEVSVVYGDDTNYTYFAISGANSSYSGILEYTITYEGTTPSGPSISATDVTYEADATKGEIPYTINNGDGSTLSASSETAWISIVTVDAEKVTFDMAKNTDAAPREGVVTLTYGSVTKNVTVTQKAPVIKYNITWSVNGVTTTEQVEQGQPITFDNAPQGIPADYVFTGWYGGEYFNATDAPVYVSSATATADVTYYAVFAKKSEGGEEPSLVKMTMSDNFKDGDKVVIVASVDATTVYGIYQETYNSSYVGKFEFENDVESISKDDKCWLTVSGTDGKWVFGDDTYGYLYSSGSNNLSVNTSDKTEFTLETDEANGKFKIKATESKRYLSYRSDISTKYFRLAGTSPTGTFRFDIYKYVCGSVSYSDFRTSLADVPATATITLSEKCTDGEMYYGTYSSTKPFVVSDDIIVSEISVIDNQLYVEEYASGAVVPANIGVMVSSTIYGNHEVALSEEVGESVLGEENMLRPTGDAGITAAEMAAKDAACKYYRLTMHKGETLGYFYGAAEGAAFNIAAGKAYLAVPEALASKVLGFAIGGGVTGIGAVVDNGNAADQRTVYNLQGQRVNGKLAKGVYIVNGKKVIIK